MKIYLASTAPGCEGGKNEIPYLELPRRLFSYHHIKHNVLVTKNVFNSIIGESECRKK